MLGSWNVVLWSGDVWVEWDPWAFPEVNWGVWGLWVVMVVPEAVLELKL